MFYSAQQICISYTHYYNLCINSDTGILYIHTQMLVLYKRHKATQPTYKYTIYMYTSKTFLCVLKTYSMTIVRVQIHAIILVRACGCIIMGVTELQYNIQ